MTESSFASDSGSIPPESVQARIRVGDRSLVENLAPEWRAMLQDSGWNQPFFQPEWVLSYLEAFNPNAPVVLVEGRRQGKLQAVFPLVESQSRGPAFRQRVLEGAANAHSCRFDLILGTPSVDHAVVQAVWTSLRDAAEWSAARLPDALTGSALSSLASLAEVDGWCVGQRKSLSSPIIDLPVNVSAQVAWEEFSKGLGSRFRGSLRTWRKRLEARGPVSFTCVEEPSREALERFYALEGASWKGLEGTAINCAPETRQFYDLVAARLGARGMLRLYELRAGESTVAMHYGLELAGTYYMPKLAYDERFRDCAPGHLLMAEVIQDCLARGLRHFDCLGAADEWKLRWTDEVRDHQTISLFRPSAYARLIYAIQFPLRDAARHVQKRVANHAAMLG